MMNTALAVAALLGFAVFTSRPLAIGGEWYWSGGVVTMYQSTSDARIKSEWTASADLVLTRPTDRGEWRFYLEANSTPHDGGVSGVLPEANADAGSALDPDRKGRVQLSELNYRHTFNRRQSITVGLVDVSGYFDQSRIASDETTHFLGVSFVENPTIEFPDYSLGLIYEQALAAGPTLRAGLVSSHGLADNPKHSYPQLVDLDADDKGVFAIASATWKSPDRLLRTGVWTHTANHDRLDGGGAGEENYGAYLLAEYQTAPHSVNLRLGVANAAVTRAAGFVGVSYRYLRGAFALGAGAARIFLSSEAPDAALDDTTQREIFLRYAPAQEFYLTGDIQQIINSNFDSSGKMRDRAVAVYGVRVTYLFQ